MRIHPCNALVHDNLTDGSSADEQLEFMQDRCAQAAELLGLHKKARQVQSREYIAGNKRVMSVDLTARKQQRLLQSEQPNAIECTVRLLNQILLSVPVNGSLF